MVSRTFFTQDVNEAFEELEEGNEDALKVSPAICCSSQARVMLKLNSFRPLHPFHSTRMLYLSMFDKQMSNYLAPECFERLISTQSFTVQCSAFDIWCSICKHLQVILRAALVRAGNL